MRHGVVFGSILWFGILPVLAWAGDYKPVHCKAAQAYAGAPLKRVDLTQAFAITLPSGTMDAATSARLDAAFGQASDKTRAVSITAAVALAGGEQWQAASAHSDRLYFWASAGKTLTAIAILQLVDEGRLGLEDPIAKWVDGVPNGDVITIRHLLTHTGGLFSANEDAAFRKSPHRMAADEELAILRRHGAMFCPGANWRYSNSGYALLGIVLEKVEQKPYDRVITERIIDRLHIANMRAVTPADRLADVVAPVSQTTEAAIDVHQPGAAGGVVASAPAMIALWRGLLSDGLLRPETTRAMFAEFYPMFGASEAYGQGVMLYDPPVPAGAPPILWVGHSGGAPGVKAVVAYSLPDKAFVAVALTGDGPAEAAAALLLRAAHQP